MNILFLAHRIPYPPNKGDKIRSYHLLAHLARRGNVDLVTHADDLRDLRHRQVLADMCRSVEIIPLSPIAGRLRALACLASRTPLSVAYMTRPSARERVKELLRTHAYDFVVGFSSQVGAYLPREGCPPTLMDFVDVDSEKWASYGRSKGFIRGAIDRLEGRRLQRFERELGERVARVVLTTEREVQLWQQKIGAGNLIAIGNGVILPDEIQPAGDRDGQIMVFVGAMDYEANVDAVEFGAREILPRIRARCPNARFRIVGRNPSPRVLALSDVPGVEVTGEVVDLKPHLSVASLALVPLRVARGVQNKVLEAMAYGLPVVSTPPVLASLASGAERGVVAGDTAEDLARLACDLLERAELRTERGRAAREFVETHHDWRSFDRSWDDLLDAVVGKRQAHLGVA